MDFVKKHIVGTNKIKETIPNFKEDYVLYILASALEEEKINKAKEILEVIKPDMEVRYDTISLNVTAHAGPGALGIAIMKKYKM